MTRPEHLGRDARRRRDIERGRIGSLVDGWYVYGIPWGRDVRVKKKLRLDISRYVPDAEFTSEVWAVEPIRLDLIGTIEARENERGKFQIRIVPAGRRRR